MKTKSIFTLLFIFIVVTLCGQVPQPQFEVTDSTVDLSIAIDAVIEDLDLSDVTTNILYDRGWKLGSLENFDGTTTSDTVSDHGAWLRQYGSLVTAYRGAPAASPVPSITTWKAQRNAAVANGKNPLVMMHIDYNQFLTDSVLLSTLIYENNGKLEDYPNQSTSPFEERTAFSFSPYLSTVYDSLSLNFQTDPLFFKSNYGSTVSTIHVDFDNGSGYRSIGTNGSAKVSWTTFGTKILKLKVAYANGQTFYAKSTLNLVQTLNYRPPGSKSNKYADHTEPISHPSDPAYTAELQIEYACGHDKLIKPYIFVEGFSPEQFQPNLTYEDYYDNLLKYQQKYTSDYQLLDELFENGYDIVYVDFAQGTGDIIKNAEVLAEAIKWVNGEKAANGSTEQNVVVGYSMGGLIARLGIRYLELDTDPNVTPDVSYYISVDAPHLGANVPLGLTLAIDDLYNNVSIISENLGEYEEGFQDAYDVLNSPAAKQMLIYSFDIFDIGFFGVVWDNTTRTNFVNELNTMGFPTTTIQNIAIAKGNGIGAEQHFGSLDPLLNIDVQNNFDCFDDLVDIYNLTNFNNNSGVAQYLEGRLNLFLGNLITVATLLGTRADFELDINAMPGHVPESYQIYERRIQFRILWIVPVGGSHRKIKIAEGYPYDSCPGSTYSVENFSLAGGDIGPLLNGDFAPCMELHEQDFCFIPTYSALNVTDLWDSPYTPIDPVSIVANNQTPFDKAFLLNPTMYPPNTAPTNESHISFSPSNINPFEGYISPDFNAVNENPTVHGYTFNFGYAKMGHVVTETTDQINHPLTVSGISSANGAIWINRADHLANKNDNNNPISTSNHFSVELRKGCDGNYGRVTVESLGSIVIGEDHSKTADIVVRDNCWIKMNDGFIEVRDGSKLIIEEGAELRLNGGLLRIQDGGEVIIKAGGKLIYEDGAQIELNGNDAVLALGGLTRIGDNATFTFTYQGNESGYIRMLKEGFWGQRFSVGTNAEFRLQGENATDLILYMEESADFWEYKPNETVPNDPNQSHLFDYVQFKDGKITMDQSARIVLLNDARFIRTQVEASDAQHPPRGIVTFTFCDIVASNFYKINIEAQYYFTEPGTLYLTNSNFDGAFYGSNITVRGEGMRIRGCSFEHVYIDIDQSIISNSVQESVFQQNSSIFDTSPTELFIYKTEFINNTDAVGKEMGRVTAKCSRFEGNVTGISAGKLGEVNLSTLYNGGYNYFDHNDYNVNLYYANDLLMRDGYNQFYDGNIMNVVGTLDNSTVCPHSINAYNNTWTPLSDTSVPYGDPAEPDQADFDVNITTGGGGNPVVCHVGFNFGPVAEIATCGEFDDPRDPKDPEEELKSNSETVEFPLISSPTYFDSIPFDLALRQAASTTTISDTLTGDDLLAADMYYELLELAEMDSIPNDSITAEIERMKWGSLGNYKAIIERLFANTVITKDENQSIFNPTVANYVSVLMAFTDSIKTPANYKTQFGLEMMKASLFKTIGKKDQALHILENMNYCDQDSLQKLILEEQIQNVTFDLLAETYGSDMYLIDSITFVLDSSIYQIPLESYIDTTGFGSYIEGPNSIYFSSCNDAFQQKSFGSSTVKNLKFNVYPNPTRTKLEVQIMDNSVDMEAGFTFSLLDFTGKTMFSQKIASIHSTLNLPKLASALYFYQILSKGKVVEQGKISILN